MKNINKTSYIVRTYEEECGDNVYIVTVPCNVTKNEVYNAFEIATKYVQHSCSYFDTILNSSNITEDELDDIYENDFARYVELGKEVFDEYFEEMYEMEEEHRLDIFQHYIKECMGWKIKHNNSLYTIGSYFLLFWKIRIVFL